MRTVQKYDGIYSCKLIFRMSLKFLLQSMEAIILVQIRGFKDFWENEKGREHVITQKLHGFDWNKTEDKMALCKHSKF